jgi:queuosine precursor transporter
MVLLVQHVEPERKGARVGRVQPGGRYFDLLLAAFVSVLLCSALIGAPKLTSLFGYEVSAVAVFFPLSYLLGDVITEVYGLERGRRAVWTGFAAVGFASFMALVVLAMPPGEHYDGQAALESVFRQTPRLAVAGLTAYLAGEMTNAYVLSGLKARTGGRFLWLRTIGSTLVGEAVDSAIFYPIAFYGLWPNETLLTAMLMGYLTKCLVEAALTPVTYLLVSSLRRAEAVSANPAARVN